MPQEIFNGGVCMVKKLTILFVSFWLITSCAPQGLPVEVQPSLTSTPNLESQRPEGNAASGSIAYIGANGDLYLSQGRGSDPQRITGDARTTVGLDQALILYTEPTWSPDGRQLAYIRTELKPDSQVEYRLDIFHLENFITSTVFMSEDHAPFYIYWSPNGKALSFLASTEGEEINLWTSGEGVEAQIVDQGQPYYWTWMADGERMLAHIGGSIESNPEGARLRFVGLEYSEQVDLGISPLNFQAPVLSPTGKQILVVGRTESVSDGLFLLSSEGELLAKLGDTEGRVAFDYSPSGRYLALVMGSEIEGVHVGKLVVMDLVNLQNPRTLPPVAHNIAAFWWSPTEDRLLYFVPNLVPENLTQPVHYGAQGDVDIRIQANIYDPIEDNSYLLMNFTPTQEFFRIMPYYDQYQRSATIWSPEGSHIVYCAALSGRHPGIFVIEADGMKAPIQVGEGLLGFWSFR
jgi:Tol biopolymer transport system component